MSKGAIGVLALAALAALLAAAGACAPQHQAGDDDDATTGDHDNDDDDATAADDDDNDDDSTPTDDDVSPGADDDGSPQDVFAVGSSGTILHYDGTAWVQMTSGTTADLFAVTGLTATDVYAIGEYSNTTLSAMLHYDGKSWTEVPNRPGGVARSGQTIADIWEAASGEVYVAGTQLIGENEDMSEGVVWRYQNDLWSIAWHYGANLQADFLFFKIWGASPSEIYVVGNWVQIFPEPEAGTMIGLFDGSGWRWTFIDPNGAHLYGIGGISPNSIFAGGTDDSGNQWILRREGQSWLPVNDGGGGQIYGVWGISPTDIYFADAQGNYATLLHFDGGSVWNSIPLPQGFGVKSLWGTSRNIFAAGLQSSENENVGVVYQFDGTTWSAAKITTPNVLEGIWGVASGN